MPEESDLNSKSCSNLYELIMIAAKEARRLNEFYRNRNVQPKERVTTEAIRHVCDDGVAYNFRAPDTPEETSEAPKE